MAKLRFVDEDSGNILPHFPSTRAVLCFRCRRRRRHRKENSGLRRAPRETSNSVPVDRRGMADALDALEALREHLDESGRPVASAPEVAERLPVGRRRAHQLLEALEAAGEVDSYTFGRARVWWPKATVRGRSDGPVRASPGGAADGSSGGAAGGNAEESAVITPEAHPDELAPLLDEIYLPGSGDLLEERRAAVRACVHHLRETGEETKSGFLDHVFPDHPAGYGSEGGWWNAIRPAFRELSEEIEAIRPPGGEGAHRWRWVD
jgi:hypothetical protein